MYMNLADDNNYTGYYESPKELLENGLSEGEGSNFHGKT